MSREVLVVEDSRVFRDLVGLVLENEGFSVTFAADGAEALAVLTEREPAAIVLDLAMPKVDGWEVLSEMRRLGIALESYIAVITSDDDPSHADELRRQGVAEVHVKPLDCDGFAAGLRRRFELGAAGSGFAGSSSAERRE